MVVTKCTSEFHAQCLSTIQQRPDRIMRTVIQLQPPCREKDVLVVTAPDSGAEVIPFLKTYVNLPGAVAFTVLYSKLCNSAEQVID